MTKKKRPCCNCHKCKCHCHNEAEGFLGRVMLKFYDYPDSTHKVGIALNREDDLPDPKKNPRGFFIMSLLVAQVADYAKKQMVAMDMLTVSKKEIEIMLAQQEAKKKEAKADIDRYQKTLPGFETDD